MLVENVKGYPGWRVAGNIFYDMEAVKLALGVEKLEEVGERLIGFAWRAPPKTLAEKIRSLSRLFEFGRFLPKRVSKAPFLENVVEKPVNLQKLIPAFRQYPGEPAPYLTYPLVVVKHPDTGAYTASVYRVMVRDDGLVLHWQMHKRGQLAYAEWGRQGAEEIPAAIVVSADPATLLTGAFPVPYPIDKYLFAGMLRGAPLPVYRLDNGIEVPANAELVIEGYVTRKLVPEGPFGDHWGYYDEPQRRFPLMRIERIYYRHNPVYYGTVVGLPPLEDAVIGKAVERISLPILRTIMPEIVDMNLPPHGLFQGIAIVSIRKMYPGHAKKVMMGLWGLGMLSLTKMIIVVDHDVNVHDLNQVIWAVAANVDPQRDVVIVPGAHTDELDPATPVPGYGSKLGIDATRKLPEEYGGREWPRLVEDTAGLDESVAKALEELGIRL